MAAGPFAFSAELCSELRYRLESLLSPLDMDFAIRLSNRYRRRSLLRLN